MRTFVAIELPDACRRRLTEAVEQLRRGAGGVKWVRTESAHLTLKFIGELPELDLPAAIEALRTGAQGASPFSFRVQGISVFPPKGAPRVIHAPVEEPTGALAGLAQSVDRALCEGLGVAPEKRSFKPHITLGRVKKPRDCPPIETLAGLVPNADFGEAQAREIILMKSDLTPRGAVYTPVERVKLEE